MSDKNFRELQVSSSQLVVIFLAILILGLIVFLLGVSVGKKQTEIVLQAAGGSPAVKETAEIIKPNLPLQAEKAAGAEAKPLLNVTSQPQAGVTAPKQAAAMDLKSDAKPESKPKESAVQTPERVKPAQPKEKAKEPAVKSKKQTIFYVQVGAFNMKEQAQNWAARFREDGYPTIVVEPNPEDKKPFYRVRLGGYLTKEEAEEVKAKLKPPSRKSGNYLIIRIES